MKKERRYDRMGWSPAVFGMGVGLVSVPVLTGGFAWMIHREILGMEHMDLAAAAVLVVGGVLCGCFSGGGEGRLLRSCAAAGGLILALLVICLGAYDGSLRGLLPGGGAVLGGAAAAALVRGRGVGRRSPARRYGKYRNR